MWVRPERVVTRQAPEAHAYESQSTGIVELLKRLQDDFRGKLAECQKAVPLQQAWFLFFGGSYTHRYG